MPDNSNSIVIEKLAWVADVNRKSADSCDKIISLLKEHPELDEHFVRVFGVTPIPPQMK